MQALVQTVACFNTVGYIRIKDISLLTANSELKLILNENQWGSGADSVWSRTKKACVCIPCAEQSTAHICTQTRYET